MAWLFIVIHNARITKWIKVAWKYGKPEFFFVGVAPKGSSKIAKIHIIVGSENNKLQIISIALF